MERMRRQDMVGVSWDKALANAKACMLANSRAGLLLSLEVVETDADADDDPKSWRLVLLVGRSQPSVRPARILEKGLLLPRL